MRNFFLKLSKNLARVFSLRNWRWHLLAILLTLILVETGFDWRFFIFVSNVPWRNVFFPALILGSFLPIFLPLGLFLIYFFNRNKKILVIGLAEAQAAILGSFVSSLYKAFTGRIQPPGYFRSSAVDISALVDNSHAFQFGFLRHGIFWGWPSSHTTLAFSMAVAAWVLFPKNKFLRFIVLAYAIFVGVGVAVTSIHWFSEAVAGVIFGTLIGVAVGKSYFSDKAYL